VDSRPDQPALRRVLGLPEVTAGGVGIIIGAGIYVLIGEATAQAGAAVWVSFLLAAVLCGLTGLSYMELASMFPRAGGEFEYTRQVFPEWTAFLIGWLMVAGLVVASAAVALGFAHYARVFFEVDDRILAFSLLIVSAAIAAAGVKQAGRLTVLLSVVQVAGLLLVIWIGIPHVGQVDLLQSKGAFALLGAASLVFFAYIGFDEVITLSEETEDPTRTVPLALALALGISTLLYLGVAIGSVSVLGAERLGASPQPLADVAEHSLGEQSGQLMAVLAMVSTTNTTLLALTAASRMLYGMASHRELPYILAGVSRRTGTPLRAIAFATVISAAFLFLRDLSLVARVTDSAIYLVFLAVNATVIILRHRKPDIARPFRIPWAVHRVPVTAMIGFFATMLMLTQLELKAVLLCGLLGVAGLTLRAVRRQTGMP